MTMELSHKILETLDQLKVVFHRHDQPGTNQSALRQVKALVSDLRGHHSYITEKAGQIQRLAEQFYSERAYLKYPGGHARLMADMSYDLPGRIRGQIEHLKAQGNAREEHDAD